MQPSGFMLLALLSDAWGNPGTEMIKMRVMPLPSLQTGFLLPRKYLSQELTLIAVGPLGAC